MYANLELINKKMAYYNEEFSMNKLVKNINALRGCWKKELTGFTTNLPEFDSMSKVVIKLLSKMYKK